MLEKIINWFSCKPSKELSKEYVDALLEYWETRYLISSNWCLLSHDEKTNIANNEAFMSTDTDVLINALKAYDKIKINYKTNVQLEYKSIYYKKLINTLVIDKYIFKFLTTPLKCGNSIPSRLSIAPFSDVSSFSSITNSVNQNIRRGN